LDKKILVLNKNVLFRSRILFQTRIYSIFFGTKAAKRKLPILKERWFDIAIIDSFHAILSVLLSSVTSWAAANPEILVQIRSRILIFEPELLDPYPIIELHIEILRSLKCGGKIIELFNSEIL
jgi:hypothetical protein